MGVSHTLKDIRPKAEEKARRKAEGLLQETPSGDGFMSERTRAKETFQEEVNTYTGENARKIAARAATAQEDRILRVAAYAGFPRMTLISCFPSNCRRTITGT